MPIQFAHVTGSLIEDASGYRILVTLDDRAQVRTVRDERVETLLRRDGTPDALWTADQLTQETIGTDLAEEGWEALAAVESEDASAPGPTTVSYLVRRM
jgi:hypothetical protein